MPRPCPALTMPFFSRPRHSTAVERRPVGYLPAFGFFRLPRGVPRRLLSEAYQSPSQRSVPTTVKSGRLRLKCDGTRAETRCRLSAKRTSPFKSAGGRQFNRLLAAEVYCISGSNAGYTMFRGSVKSTGYPLHSPFSPLLPLPCVTVCHNISTAL
jgi:hypothetical protein